MTLFAIDNSNWKSMHPAFLSPQRQTLQLRKRTHKQRLIQLLANYDQPAKAFCTCLWPPDVLKSAPIVVESVVCANLHVMSRENFVQQEKRPSTKPSPASRPSTWTRLTSNILNKVNVSKVWVYFHLGFTFRFISNVLLLFWFPVWFLLLILP